jgi:hypothetical protein
MPYINVGVEMRNGETTTHLFVSREWYAPTLDTKTQVD